MSDVLELRLPIRLATPNRSRGYHWRKKHRDTHEFQGAINIIGGVDLKAWSVVTGVEWRLDRRGHQRPYELKRKERRRVTIIRLVKHASHFITDDDNLAFSAKPLNDALKRVGLIYDDSRTWLEQPPIEQQVSPDGKPYTIVRIERLTEATHAV